MYFLIRFRGAHASVQREQDRVALDVSVNDALRVEIRQRLQHRLTHGRDLLLAQPGHKITQLSSALLHEKLMLSTKNTQSNDSTELSASENVQI